MNMAAGARRSGRALFAASLFMVYIVWGTSYLAMKWALEGFTPMLLTGLRTLLAGVLLWALLRRRGGRLPRAGRAAETACGLLIITVGGSLLAASLRTGSSGAVAVMFSAMPIFTCLMGSWSDGHVPPLRWLGAGLGAFGIALLSWHESPAEAAGWAANAYALGSALATAVGTFWLTRGRRDAGTEPGERLLACSAWQLLVGGAATTALGFAAGERVVAWPGAGAWAAFSYLVLVVSALGYLAFNHVTRQAGPAVATSYAFVNPLVAVALGAALLGEPFGAFHVLVMGITLLGVALVLQPPPAKDGDSPSA